VYQIDANAAAPVRLRLFSFPGWRVEIDGSPVAHDVEPESGAVLFDAPSGVHTVRAVFGSTWDRRLGWATSFGAAIAIAFLALRTRR
jgi:hypothetical protein